MIETNRASAQSGPGRGLLVFLVVVIVLAAAGFVFKLVEFTLTLRADASVSFALMPLVTYLIVASGFFCLLLWSVLGGHFRNIEEPKMQLLEREAKLDAQLDTGDPK